MSRPPDPAVEARARGKFVPHARPENEHRRRSRRKQQARAPPDEDNDEKIDAYDIPTFCKRHGGMSESFFHKLRSLGLGPAIMKVGARTLISRESAARWRAEREVAAQQESAA